MIRPEYELEALIDLLSSARERGGVASPPHPGLARAKEDGYAIIQLLDGGQLCEVWLGLDPAGLDVAIKCVRESVVEPGLAERLLTDEYAVMSELRGAAGIQPIARGGDGAATYLVLPWVEGEPIDEAAAMDPAKAPRWARSALDRLANIHAAGVIHGDLKPEHLIATAGGVVVLDFGLARRVGQADRPSLVPRIAGKTPAFAPPDADPSRAADAYAMGKVLERLLPHLSGSDAAAVRRVVALSAQVRDTTDGDELLARYDGTLRRRRRVVRSATVAATATTLVAAVLGSVLALLGQWPEMFGAAVPGVVVERAPVPLSPWSAAFVELSQNSDARTVLHQTSAIAIRATPPNDAGEIAWLLHNNQVEVWSPVEGARVVELPDLDTIYSINWSGRDELRAITRAGEVWLFSGGVPQRVAQLDPDPVWSIETDEGLEGWSRQTRRVVRATPDGLQVNWPQGVAAMPLGEEKPGWVVVDEETHKILEPSRDGDALRVGESVTATYRNEGDVALGLSSGDLMWSRGGGPWERYRVSTRQPVRALCLSPDATTALVGGADQGVLAFDLERQEVVASPEAPPPGLICSLDLDPTTGVLTVVTTWGAEAWRLVPFQTSQATP
ncbi:MAG: hypothetical protein AAGI54_04065 [Planctomycetota bacterium]